ncbi:metal-sensitive transcriptional regulator [Pseudarthrobacter sp. J1738]|uniref:metal-sensitive transcriptional regulator n=1 Tax=unclassified Pseudarthrobacter TaxID=2647000 RepID=UPI003D2C1300
MSSTLTPRPPESPAGAGNRRTVNRLKRARGQLNALIDAVESGADCRNAVTQLAAVRGALDKAGFELISAAMRDCLTVPAAIPAEGEGRGNAPGRQPSLQEIRALFLRLT